PSAMQGTRCRRALCAPISTVPTDGRIHPTAKPGSVPRLTRCVHIPCPLAALAITLVPCLKNPLHSSASRRSRRLHPPPPPPPPPRPGVLGALASEQFDPLIIGGGVPGAGAARDAALRGLRVALVEREDFASGPSSRSSRLIHGGVRYLEHGHLALVFESSIE